MEEINITVGTKKDKTPRNKFKVFKNYWKKSLRFYQGTHIGLSLTSF